MEKSKEKRAKRSFPDTFKKQVVSEFLQGASYQALVDKYSLCNTTIVYYWRKAFENELLSTMPDPQHHTTDPTPGAPSSHGDGLEEKLAIAHLKIKALEVLIEQAEKEYGIQIKKKSGPRPSRP